MKRFALNTMPEKKEKKQSKNSSQGGKNSFNPKTFEQIQKRRAEARLFLRIETRI